MHQLLMSKTCTLSLVRIARQFRMVVLSLAEYGHTNVERRLLTKLLFPLLGIPTTATRSLFLSSPRPPPFFSTSACWRGLPAGRSSCGSSWNLCRLFLRFFFQQVVEVDKEKVEGVKIELGTFSRSNGRLSLLQAVASMIEKSLRW